MTIPIQDTPAVTDGAQEPLAIDSKKSTHGFDSANQNSLSFSRGPEVPASSADVASRNGLSDGAQVRGVGVTVTQVGHRAIEGSNGPNDFRKSGDVAAASLAAASGSAKGPRDSVQQAPFRKGA